MTEEAGYELQLLIGHLDREVFRFDKMDQYEMLEQLLCTLEEQFREVSEELWPTAVKS